MTLLPKIKLKAAVNFPATVLDGTGIDVTKSNGTYRFDLDFADFAPPVSSIADPTHQNFLLWNNLTGQYALASTSLITTGPTGPVGPAGPTGPPGATGSGSGNVTGPGSAVADRIAVYNGTSGTIIKDGGKLIAELAPLTSPAFIGTISLGGSDFATKSGGYTKVFNGDASGAATLQMGGVSDPTNYFLNTSHKFLDPTGFFTFASLTATALTANVASSFSVASRTGAGTTPHFNIGLTNETITAGTGFFLNTTIASTRSGGTGHREALHVEQLSSASGSGEFNVGANFIGRATAGNGSHFGLNSYVWVDAAAGATTEACSYEANTDVRRTVVRKVGIQVVDVTTSVSSGTTFDAGIIIGKQSGGVGYSSGLSFGFDGTTGLGILSGGTLISCPSTAVSLRAGIDLEGVTTWSTAPIILGPNAKGVYWGSTKAGGAVISETTTGGANIAFGNAVTTIRTAAGTAIATFSTGTGQTYLTFWDGTSYFLRRLICGAADSAGSGYRTVKVEN